MLATQTFGEDQTLPPVLIAHGLYGSGRNWGVIAKRLSDTRRVVTVDMRNHAGSAWFDSHTYPELGEDLAQVIASLGGEADVIGHSMGGKAAMVLALNHPQAVRRLLVADIAPIAYAHTQTHLITAMREVDLNAISTRRDADRALAGKVDDIGIRAFLLQSLDLAGRKWRLNLDVLERDMAQITGFPEMDGVFDQPVLFLAGAMSDYIQPEHRAEIKRLFPKAQQAKIPDAGHWLHAERPRAFEAAARAFLCG